jgi:hypothetical protein
MISSCLLRVFKLSPPFLTLACINLLIAAVSNALRSEALVELTSKKGVSA